MKPKRLALIGAVLLLAAIVLFLVLRRKPAEKVAGGPSASEPGAAPRVPAAPKTKLPPAQTFDRAPRPTGPPLVPIIDESSSRSRRSVAARRT